MKTTVDLPDDLYSAARGYASERGKTFRQVLVESLESLIGPTRDADFRPGWEKLFGALKDDPELESFRLGLDAEFSQIDLESWK